jgi:hypothetical protein
LRVPPSVVGVVGGRLVRPGDEAEAIIIALTGIAAAVVLYTADADNLVPCDPVSPRGRRRRRVPVAAATAEMIAQARMLRPSP